MARSDLYDRDFYAWTKEQAAIANSRDEILDHLADNPSLKSLLDPSLASAYRYARRKAAVETNLAEETFPPNCPWSFDEIMSEEFWPED